MNLPAANLWDASTRTVRAQSAEADDGDLVARLGRGDPAAFDALVDRYAQRVTRLAARLLGWSSGAEDVAQDVFVKLLGKPKQFRGDAKLWTYLTVITVNRCRSLQRRQWLQQRVMQLIGSRLVTPDVPREPRIERDETAERIRAAVAQLPTNLREVIVLRYFEELGVEQVAEILSLRRNAVEVRLSRARKLLEPFLIEFQS
jgi:RNA polymerase sigma factor (sigma-70 family)